jgi:hypothetical protein
MTKKKTLKIHLEDGSWKTVECFLKKNGLAVTKHPHENMYNVTQVKTGYFIAPHFCTKKVATAYCDVLSKIYKWDSIKSRNEAKKIKDLKIVVRAIGCFFKGLDKHD